MSPPLLALNDGMQTLGASPTHPASSSQRSCCSGYPGSVPEKANHINDTQGTVGAEEGS